MTVQRTTEEAFATTRTLAAAGLERSADSAVEPVVNKLDVISSLKEDTTELKVFVEMSLFHRSVPFPPLRCNDWL